MDTPIESSMPQLGVRAVVCSESRAFGRPTCRFREHVDSRGHIANQPANVTRLDPFNLTVKMRHTRRAAGAVIEAPPPSASHLALGHNSAETTFPG